MDGPVSTAPTPGEIRAQVDRMIASDDFKHSPQLGTFLRFIVEAVLRGEGDRIKAYTIGVEVMRRDSRFDPQLDPIVRVEATRLRRTIDRYYAGQGRGDEVRIALPRGSYVPILAKRIDSAMRADAAPILHDALRRRWPVYSLLTVLIGAGAIGLAAALFYRPNAGPGVAVTGSSPPAPWSERPGAQLPPGNGMPILLMPAFDVRGMPSPHSISAQSLHDALTDAFSHFDLVNVLLASAGGNGAAAPMSASYRFTGSVEYSHDGAGRLSFKLVDTADGSVVWSRTFDRVPADDEAQAEVDTVVRQLAGILLQPFGVIYAYQRQKILGGAPSDPRYRCLVEVIGTFASFDPAQNARGRDCLDRLTARDPGFALGFVYLAALDLREYQYGTGSHPGDTPPLDRGLTAARRGVELNPESSRAYEMLFNILFARHDLGPAFDAANKAIALNKYDMRSLGAYGARLIAIGDIDKGMMMLRQAGDDSTVRPPFEEFFMFLGEYLRNRMAYAAFHADQLTGNTFQLGLIARALIAADRGDRDGAGRALAQLVALNPAWRDNPRGMLAHFFDAPEVIDRLAHDLAAAGLRAGP